jgi:hypothetical protein
MAVNEQVLKEASKIILAYFGTFLWAMIFQTTSKFKAAAAHKKEKAGRDSKIQFNRYTDPHILAGDRCVGNWQEWAIPFLLVFWLNVLLTGKEQLHLGWVYVFSRALYPLLAVNGGITLSGAKPLIFIATMPGYYVILRLAYHAYQAL